MMHSNRDGGYGANRSCWLKVGLPRSPASAEYIDVYYDADWIGIVCEIELYIYIEGNATMISSSRGVQKRHCRIFILSIEVKNLGPEIAMIPAQILPHVLR